MIRSSIRSVSFSILLGGLATAPLQAAVYYINFDNSAAGGEAAAPLTTSATWINFNSNTANGEDIDAPISQAFGAAYALTFTPSEYANGTSNFRAFSSTSTTSVGKVSFVSRSGPSTTIPVNWSISGIAPGDIVRVYGVAAATGSTGAPLVNFAGDGAVSVATLANATWETAFASASSDSARLATFTYIGDFTSTGAVINGTYSISGTATTDWAAIAIEVIPEPSGALLALSGLIPLFRRRR